MKDEIQSTLSIPPELHKALQDVAHATLRPVRFHVVEAINTLLIATRNGQLSYSTMKDLLTINPYEAVEGDSRSIGIPRRITDELKMVAKENNMKYRDMLRVALILHLLVLEELAKRRDIPLLIQRL